MSLEFLGKPTTTRPNADHDRGDDHDGYEDQDYPTHRIAPAENR
jgi:hypothetical protein